MQTHEIVAIRQTSKVQKSIFDTAHGIRSDCIRQIRAWCYSIAVTGKTRERKVIIHFQRFNVTCISGSMTRRDRRFKSDYLELDGIQYGNCPRISRLDFLYLTKFPEVGSLSSTFDFTVKVTGEKDTGIKFRLKK